MNTTWSPRLILLLTVPVFTVFIFLDNLRCEAHDLHEILLTQLTSYGAEHMCSDLSSVFAADFLVRSDDDGVVNFTFFRGAIGRSFLHRHFDLVAEASDLCGRTADRCDHYDALCTRIICDR